MGTTFSGPDPWPQITRTLKTRGPRRAAIAYLGADAPQLLPLRRGDILVVNADRPALRAHATSPEALQKFFDRGVELYSLPSLHAKVVATATTAIIGSANASHHSTTAAEAVVISDAAALVAQARAFVDQMKELSQDPVDEEFIDWAQGEWDRGAPAPVIGVSADPPDVGDFPPRPVNRLFIVDSVDRVLSPEEAADEQRARRAVRRSMPGGYRLEYLEATDPLYQLDDVLLLRHDDGDTEWLYGPYVVASAGRTVGRTVPGGVGYHLKFRRGDKPIPVAEATTSLSAHGFAGSLRPRQVRSAALREALLGLWDR
ncbi:phosphatidylserine/phosphatidylglycerophosphate/cardiolipin synthase family protein [Nocardia rhamnosiphila]|uniref:phosphatidylserine/phosphatidylglycerophosphate/ cardiolipin synthase family protein n=1 Tax=Nocardia rhamnosiphila TaxID=426716 RepID=UPI0033F0B112